MDPLYWPSLAAHATTARSAKLAMFQNNKFTFSIILQDPKLIFALKFSSIKILENITCRKKFPV